MQPPRKRKMSGAFPEIGTSSARLAGLTIQAPASHRCASWAFSYPSVTQMARDTPFKRCDRGSMPRGGTNHGRVTERQCAGLLNRDPGPALGEGSIP